MMTFNVDSLDCQWMDKTIIEYKKYMNLYSEDEWNLMGLELRESEQITDFYFF